MGERLEWRYYPGRWPKAVGVFPADEDGYQWESRWILRPAGASWMVTACNKVVLSDALPLDDAKALAQRLQDVLDAASDWTPRKGELVRVTQGAPWQNGEWTVLRVTTAALLKRGDASAEWFPTNMIEPLRHDHGNVVLTTEPPQYRCRRCGHQYRCSYQDELVCPGPRALDGDPEPERRMT